MIKEKSLVSSPRVYTIHNGWNWFTICMLAPAGGALLRKLLPGQPSFAEVAAVIPILLATIWAMLHGRILPRWVAQPLLYWGIFQIAFALPSTLEDWRVGASVLFTRVAPMFMVVVAYNSIRSWSDFRNASKWLAWLPVILLPIGLSVVFYGNTVLPAIFQPVDKVLVVDRDLRGGFPSAATIFTTQWILSWSALATLYAALANLLLPAPPAWTRNQRILFFFAVFASLLLIYVSIRRGALVAGVVGFIMTVVWSRRSSSLWILLFAFVASLGISSAIDSYGYIVGTNTLTRSGQSLILGELDPIQRLTDVFLPHFTFWCQNTPFGNYLGFAGPEVSSLGVLGFSKYNPIVEVGGAQLVAEMGILGAITMPLVLIIVGANIFRRSRNMLCAPSISVLLLFQIFIFFNYYFKELLALANPSMGVFFFWAVPGLCAALIDYESSSDFQNGGTPV